MAEKRLPKRLFTRIRAEYGTDNYANRGLVLNLSADGVFVSGRVVTNSKAPVSIRLVPEDVPPIELRGRMRWAKQSPPRLRNIVREGMGIQLIDPSAAYIAYFKTLAERFERRGEPRIDAAFHVRFRHRDEFVKQYTENISAGGLFIATDQTVERDTILDITMFIPDLAQEIAIKGRVVYILDDAGAARFECAKGIGVQILEMSPADRSVFDGYVERVLEFYSVKPQK